MLFAPLRFIAYLNPWNWTRRTTRGEALRLSLEELGPIFVKFGQALRPDRIFYQMTLPHRFQNYKTMSPHFPSEQALESIESLWRICISTL